MPNPAIPRGVNDGLELWPENVAHAQVGERSLIVLDLSRSIFFVSKKVTLWKPVTLIYTKSLQSPLLPCLLKQLFFSHRNVVACWASITLPSTRAMYTSHGVLVVTAVETQWFEFLV